MKRIAGLVLFAATLASAQKTEVGATLGWGAAGASDVDAQPGVTAGVEACFVCRGNFAPFAEYVHLQAVNNVSSIKSFDLMAGGLRLQSRGRVRPFFDVGFAYGIDRYGYNHTDSHGNPGMVLAGGASVPLGSRAYIRPQARLYILRGHAVFTVGAGIGIRF